MTNDAADALRQLRRRLIEAPEEKFIEVVKVLELAGERPEIRQTIHAIRPRLAELRPARRMTLKRIFCDPFEDVLEAKLPGDGPIDAIPRRVIDPIWREVAARADSRHMEPLRAAVAALDSNDASGRHALGCRLWYAAGSALRKLLDDAPTHLGTEALAAARLIVEFVEIGHQIAALKNALPPKPTPGLNDEECALIEAAVQETARIGVQKPFYLLLVLASRMRRPADLLAALQDMDFGKAKREKPAVFAKLAGLMVGALEGAGGRLDVGPGPEAPPQKFETVVETAERLTESLEAAQRLLTGVGDAQYDERLKKVRVAVQEMVRRDVLEPARDVVVAVLPPVAPSVASPFPEDDKQEEVENQARALLRCERFADSLSLAPEVTSALSDIGAKLERDVARWRKTLADRGASPASDEAALTTLSYAVRLMELVAGSGRAEAMMRAAMRADD